jgi:FkbM family methyltransferase
LRLIMLGTLMRLPLRLIPDGIVLPILFGPGRGSRWVVGTLTHGCWIGTYERRAQDQLAHILRPGDVAYDIGANAGFFTLLISRLVGPSGHVHAFEPLPLNVARLRRHLRINNIANVTVHRVAVSDKTGAAKFCSCAHSAIGHISGDGALAVEYVALDDLDLPLPRAIKIDIEGGESLALCGMTRILRAAQPFLLVEGHDKVH